LSTSQPAQMEKRKREKKPFRRIDGKGAFDGKTL